MHGRPARAPEPPLLQPGVVLEGRFEIIQFLARGGMGEVYEVADRQMQGKHLALKTLRSEGASDLATRRPPAQAAARRRAPPPAAARPTIHRRRTPRRAAPLPDHEASARRAVARPAEPLGSHAAGRGLSIASQMAVALDAADKAGVIHRDFKPGNVMLEWSSPRAPRSISPTSDFSPRLRSRWHPGPVRPHLRDSRLHRARIASGPHRAPHQRRVRVRRSAARNADWPAPREQAGKRRHRTSQFPAAGTAPRLGRAILGCLAFDPTRRFQSARHRHRLTSIPPVGVAVPAYPPAPVAPEDIVAVAAAGVAATVARYGSNGPNSTTYFTPCRRNDLWRCWPGLRNRIRLCGLCCRAS